MHITGKTTLLKGPYNPSTGYGNDGILMSKCMVDLGVDLHLEPRYVGLPLPEEVLHLFCKERPHHFDLAIHHEYPGGLGFPVSMPHHSDFNVGWTMYEFTGFGEDPDKEMTDKLKERLNVFDLVLAYDDVSFQALSEYMPEGTLDRLKILQGGYESDFWRPHEEEFSYRDWDGTFRFCMNGAMNLRKNPWAAIYAFKLLKDEHGKDFDAELHLKTTSLVFPPQLEEWCEGLKIHYANWSAQDIRQFYLRCHCLLAPSWGEGKNLPALESQTTGMTAIVSAVGGHMQWADPSWTYLVEGPMEEHSPGMGSMRVSSDTMAEKMWYVYNNRQEAKLKGELAAKILPEQSDWSKVMYRLSSIIKDTKPKDRNTLLY